jgi:DNA recombination protein RmuC
MMILFYAAIGALVLAGVLWMISEHARKKEDPLILVMQQQIESLRRQVGDSLAQNAALLQKQLESVSRNLNSSSGEINQRLDNAAKLYGELRSQLGQLSQANAQIQAMVKDVSSLQDILRPPKLRGGMGEVLLENLLREILPPEHYELQHRFRTGNIVDGVIRLKEGLVPVDAKFPLENFRKMLEAKTDEERKAARREFARNVKKHIDDIHEKYILTEEGTFPFALMYIPAENVYYETIIKGDEDDNEKALYAYATTRQVMPVSPNSFYAYLLTLAQGFRGMRIEEKAQEILGHLARLGQELDRFSDDFQMVGRHLGNAQTKFADAEKRLARFQDKLSAAGESAPQLEEKSTVTQAPKEITTH